MLKRCALHRATDGHSLHGMVRTLQRRAFADMRPFLAYFAHLRLRAHGLQQHSPMLRHSVAAARSEYWLCLSFSQG
eukprot:SAG11_NODE_2177_length_3716_cov_2.968482_6_plen_76_part_00